MNKKRTERNQFIVFLFLVGIQNEKVNKQTQKMHYTDFNFKFEFEFNLV